jgi:hypothetical protein
MILFLLLFALVTGVIVYAGVMLGQRLGNENRTLRLQRGLLVLVGTVAFFLIADFAASSLHLGDEAMGALLFTIPLLAASIAGLLVSFHLLFGGPRGDYMP